MDKDWTPPDHWMKIRSIDAHAEGEPLRIITAGFPPLPGKTILEKRQYMQKNLDFLRKALMWEPRGHADMYGCLMTEPVTRDGTMGVIFLHNEGYSSMCGHGIIALSSVACATGLVAGKKTAPVLKIDTPAGRVTATVRRKKEGGAEVSFVNVPAFVYARDKTIDIPGIGFLRYDIAFGGAFYAFCLAQDLGLRLVAEEYPKLIDFGRRIKMAVSEAMPISHPFEEDLNFLYGTIFIGPPHNEIHHSRNVCVFADGEIDRSPTGTGVSARLALHYSRGEIGLMEPIVVESILGTCFSGRIRKATRFGPHEAIVPEITGTAHITGRHEFLIDPDDPQKYGFFLR